MKDKTLRKSFGVYQIKNLVNSKLYIGSTYESFYQRFYKHKLNLNKNKHHNQHLQNAWNKYGEENFVFEILYEETNKTLVRDLEQDYIDFFNSCNELFGYNIIRYVDKPRKGLKHSKESKERMRIAATGRKHTNETKKKISNAEKGNTKRRGKTHTPEAKEKNRTAHIGNSNRAKEFKLVSPSGDLIIDKNRTKFCRENSLDLSCINELLKGKIKQYRGWKSSSILIEHVTTT